MERYSSDKFKVKTIRPAILRNVLHIYHAWTYTVMYVTWILF